jgi:molybdopterin synthase catalytic subunit
MKTHLALTCNAIVPPALPQDALETGAQVDFQGIVRGSEDGKPIDGLHYEAHEPMAISLLEKIVSDLAPLHPCDELWIIHRLGFVPVGEAALFVRVRSRHRKAALHMTDELIDRIKKDVPIWKMLP